MNKQFNPKVSIIIPVYNGSNFLKEAVNSALAQTYKNLEIIVVNDGSNDKGETDAICKSYAKQIRYFKKENGGVATALNLGIEKMEGEYFSWLSHDDMYMPNKIEREIEELNKLEDKKTVIFSGLELVNPDGIIIEKQNFAEKYGEKNINNSLFPFFHLALNGCTMLIHKSHFDRVGSFNPQLSTTQDYDLWYRMIRDSSIHYVNEILLQSRSHPEQGWLTMLKKHVEECNTFWVKVFEDISVKEMIDLEGSVLNFYRNMYDFFRSTTGYDKAIRYLEGKLLQTSMTEYKKCVNSEQKTKIIEDISRYIYNDPDLNNELIKKLLSNKEKKRTRILFFTGNWFDRGGLNRVISIIASGLSKSYEVVVCCMKAEGNEGGYHLNENVEFLELEESEFMRIPQFLKLLNVDIFISSNNCFVPLLNLYEEIEDRGVKVIMWNHEHFFVPYFERSLEKCIDIRKAVYDKVSVSLWLTDFSANLGSIYGKRIGVMKNPLSFTVEKKLREQSKPLNLISLARFDSPRKRLDRLVRVFAEVVKRKPNTKLYILGKYDLSMVNPENTEETLKQLIERLCIPKGSMIFVGEVKDVSKYYMKASVNIMTSEREGFGLPILEAALFGVPSVVFSGGGVGELITDSGDGFVAENGDIQGMANKILTLLKDKSLLQRFSLAAYDKTKEYSEGRILSKWKALIDHVMKLNRDELKKYLDTNYLGDQRIPVKLLKDIVITYEEILQKQKEERNEVKEKIETSNDSYLGMKLKKLYHLIREQGIVLTSKNILLKIKSKLFR